VLYGPTEGTIICSSYEAKRGKKEEGHRIGRGLGNVKVRVVDEAKRLVACGVSGELLVGGEAVSRGYWKREEQTREKYVELGGERWYRTGDVVRWVGEGELEYVGRKDHQVKVRGYRIEL
jgi:non-ribosomal peptide synthetase component F